jgi:hypothetical protein
MKTARLALIAIGILAFLVFTVSRTLHRVACDFFDCAAWATAPQSALIDFWSVHRNAWLVGTSTYAIAVLFVFSGELRTSPAARRVVVLLALALLAVTLVVLRE